MKPRKRLSIPPKNNSRKTKALSEAGLLDRELNFLVARAIQNNFNIEIALSVRDVPCYGER